MSITEVKSENMLFFSIYTNFDSNKEKLQRMFKHVEEKNREFVVLSISGVKRKGKSFFVNNCLKYLYENFKSINTIDKPTQDFTAMFDNNKLGFPSSHCTDDQNDVFIWNDVFLHTKPNTGEKIGIVVIDSNKPSENAKDQNEYLSILKFMTMISSIQIINVHDEIEIHQLELLRTALKSLKDTGTVKYETNSKMFQKLVFLVRDWNNLEKFSYGIENGDKYLSTLSESYRNPNLKSFLELLGKLYQNLHCMLLPHPGNPFVNKNNFNEIDDEFNDKMNEIIKHLLNPENLVAKKINNFNLKGLNFFEFIKQQIGCYREVKIDNHDEKSKELNIDHYSIQPIQVFASHHKKADNEELKKLLNHKELNDREIVALSSIGVYRKGKSFFLNYCLRYLYSHYPSINCQNKTSLNPDNWMGGKDESLFGFSWRSGSARDTTGILMWNDAFLCTNANGEKIAIIVIDTQGLFESGSDPDEDSKIFTLTTLMSSFLIFNLCDVVQENQLEYLQFAIESAKFAKIEKNDSEEKPFQSLMFIIRDWGNYDDHACGIDGGNKYLQYFLKLKSDKNEEFKSIYEVICDSFDEINCCLLPHPGKSVAVGRNKNKKFEGCWGDMETEFKDELKSIIELILNSTYLKPRRINEASLNGPEYYAYIKNCHAYFESNQHMKVKTICDSTVDKDMNKLIISCFNSYKGTLRSELGEVKNLEELQNLYEKAKNIGMNAYNNSKKMGNHDQEVKYRKVLEEKMSSHIKEIAIEEEKNFKAIEEERKKLKLMYEQKEKQQMSNYGITNASSSGNRAGLTPSTSRVVSSVDKQYHPQQPTNVQHVQSHHTELNTILDSNFNNLVKECINEYKKMMWENEEIITDEKSFKIYHEANKGSAILKFVDSKSIGNPNYYKQYKELLINSIDQIYNDFKVQLEKLAEEQVEKDRLQKEEAMRIEKEKIQQEKRKKLEEECRREAEEKERWRELQIRKDELFALEVATKERNELEISSLQKDQKILALEQELERAKKKAKENIFKKIFLK